MKDLRQDCAAHSGQRLFVENAEQPRDGANLVVKSRGVVFDG